MAALKQQPEPPEMVLITDREQQRQLWTVRESGLGATARVPAERDAWPGWEDSAVPPAMVGPYLRDLRRLLDKYGYSASLYGHFGQGCIHARIDFDLETRQGIEAYRSFAYEAADLVIRYGGSLSGEHGDGQARGELLPKMFGEELIEAFREFKAIWDPHGKMNPGKLVDPYPIDEHLRLGTNYNPPDLETRFQYPGTDHGSFARATLRCVGVGLCRREEGGTMCPSYMVTHEELHSPRGRAHLLFEMLQGDIIKGGWRNEHVKEALDLCLACKGCKSDCPMHVDVATYKAEFLSHYYAGRPRPRSAYVFGLVFYWARLASHFPHLANFVTQMPLLRHGVKKLAGIAPQRTIPPFAPQTFIAWFRRRKPRNSDGRRVILWPDTFNNHFHPEAAIAAVEVLEDAGCTVTIPNQWLCCGRPLYDYGMLNLARRRLHHILDVLRAEIRAGTPIVGLEPSCVAVLRDELINLFPNDKDAQRLAAQTFTFGAFLQAIDYKPPQLKCRALVHGHCHHKAIMKMDGEEAILRKLGLDFQMLDAGCCGMAGAFGFEQDHYELSVACGERVLLPTVRESRDDTLIIADGFSCREQIAQNAGRRALHLAQAIRIALHTAGRGLSRDTFQPQTTTQKPITALMSLLQTAIAGAGSLLSRAVGQEDRTR
ncbi:MAG: hypothetical protein KatS3mg057_1248 [Herpetosiphonaceae bacterium]|nr:MAG: hypothetical protein KatS3mg057_1248 [Herpetosiphonaceae bacterium]